MAISNHIQHRYRNSRKSLIKEGKIPHCHISMELVFLNLVIYYNGCFLLLLLCWLLVLLSTLCCSDAPLVSDC